MIPLRKWPVHGEKFLELRSQGLSYQAISLEIPVSVTTLKAWGRDHGAEVARLSLGRAEAFVEANLLDVQSRLKLRGEMLQKMRTELASRDFSKMETPALLRHYLRFVDSVQKDVEPVRVEVTSTMQNYEQILLRCARVVDGDASDAPGELPEASDT